MCRNSKFCTELGLNPERWDTNCPLPLPKYFDELLDHFIEAIDSALEGDKQRALNCLAKTRSSELRDWFVEHGQMSGWHHRVKILNLPKPPKFEGELETNKRITPFEITVYQRDKYVCQYCGIRVVDPKVLKRIEKLLGKENFIAVGKSNDLRHGIALTFRATADHVLPMSYGGKTNLDNLVTCCWNCNYGKYNALLSQMNIKDPRQEIKKSNYPWFGLTDKF